MKHYTEFNPKSHKWIRDKTSGKHKKNPYCHNIFTLDLETSSIFKNEKGEVHSFDYSKPPEYYTSTERIGIVYIWQLSVDDVVYYGRYLSELHDFIITLNDCLLGRTGVIYVHNLAYEFQFLRNIFPLTEVFARKSRKPMSAKIGNTGFILKCSYILSGLKLENIAKQYNLPILKQVGDLDYRLLRHSETPLTEDELRYCEYDCLIVYEYIKIMIKDYGSIDKIPLTSTSKVRKQFSDHLTKEKGRFGVKNFKRNTAMLSPTLEDYLDLVRCFAGGYTHANAYYTNRLIKNVRSIDFTSSYPAVMVMEKFPVGIFSNFNLYDLKYVDPEKYAYILKLKFKNIRCIKSMTFISAHKCSKLSGVVIDNGRVYSAKELEMTMTELDWLTIRDTYNFDDVEIISCKTTVKNYMPKEFIKFVIKQYATKTKYKNIVKKMEDEGLKGTEDYYQACDILQLAKANLNSLYGMCVTNNIMDVIEFNNEWQITELTENDIQEKLFEFEEKQSLLLPYQWGVWITAYARRNLWLGIIEIDSDVVYCDTDSIKFIGDYQYFIDDYNRKIDDKLHKMCNQLKIPFEDVKNIGHFDDDGNYLEFKTLGAKKYAVRYFNKKVNKEVVEITVSGVNKKTGVNALNNDVNNFSPKLIFDYHTAGKLLSCYNDNQSIVNVTDYLGNSLYVDQPHGICLYPTTYKLDITDEYGDFIDTYQGNSEGCKILREMK